MVIGASKLELQLPGVRSLKEKRSIVKSVIAQVQRKFNTAIAEVDLHDAWQATTLGIVVVSTSANHAETMLDTIATWLEEARPDLQLLGYSTEIFYL